jgi:hypothetical protein
VSVFGLEKRARACGGVAGKHAVVCASMTESASGSGGTVPTGGAHGTERAVERTGNRADEQGPRDRENARMRGGNSRRQVGPTGQREGERERDGTDRRGLSHPVLRNKAGCISYMRQRRQHI